LFKDDVTVEYDVSLVGSPPPPSVIRCDSSQGTHQQSEKTLDVSVFGKTLNSDSRQRDEQHCAKKEEEVYVNWRMIGRIRKKPNDKWDLFKDDATVEYDVSLVGSPPPPSVIHHGSSQGTYQQSEKTLDVSVFGKTLKSDSRQRDEQHCAKKEEEVHVKLRKKKEHQSHEQPLSGKQQLATLKTREIPQSIDLNATTIEQTFLKDDIVVWSQHTFEKFAFSLTETDYSRV
jgi:hypothetical protein